MNKIGIFVDKYGEIHCELYSYHDSDKYVRVVEINELFPILHCYYRNGIYDFEYKLSMYDALDAPKMMERLNKVADDWIENWKCDIPDVEIDKNEFYILIDLYKVIDDDDLLRLEPVNQIIYEFSE